MKEVDDIINILGLRHLELEGGYYHELYRSPIIIRGESFGDKKIRKRSICSSIYYLLSGKMVSKLHSLKYDEIYHFYMGEPVKILLLFPNGDGEILTLGTDLLAGERPQIIVPAGVWQGLWIEKKQAFSLMGTVVAPGFDTSDRIMGKRKNLIKEYPQFEGIIKRLT
ncbi:MAG: cupin domain-containing protein [bacterium]